MHKQLNGFSLVELSITIVIITLIVGGTLVGQELIRAGEVRATTAEANHYTSAALSFRAKYQSLPGDFSKATTIWGINTSCYSGATPARSSTPSVLTCNGNGNKTIEDFADEFEVFLFWQHLANAGMIEGLYTGIIAPCLTPSDCIWGDRPGLSVPKAKMQGGAFVIQQEYDSDAGAYVRTHNFVFGALDSGSQYYNSMLDFLIPSAYAAIERVERVGAPILTPKEAWSIDSKMDDGKPGSGKIRSGNISSLPECVTTADEDTAEYAISVDSVKCALRFRAGF